MRVGESGWVRSRPHAGRRIGRRLILYTIGFSSLVTLVITAIQLAWEYRELRRNMDRALDSVAIYAPTIAGSVWDFDDRQIQLALQALASMPEVEYAIVRGEASRQWSAGARRSERLVTRSYALTHESRGQVVQVGTLEVAGSLDAVYRQLLGRALSIAFSNAVKTFLVALFMIALLRRVVTVRLEALGERVRRLLPQLLPLRSVVERDPQPMPSRLDELGAVDWALDRTTADLAIAVNELQHLNRDLENRVKERTRELESVNRDLQAFGYTLSHDLKAPLITLTSFIGILQARHADRLDEQARGYLRRMDAAARRMDAIIGDTLRLFTASAATLNPEPVDLSRMASEILEGLHSADPQRQVDWSVEPGLHVRGDVLLLRTALENLLGNAWKYTAREPHPRIQVRAWREAQASGFVVEDNGAGFDMAAADRLFEPFHRLHKESEFPGSGIGLSTVRRIIHRHEGRVWAEAAPGAGARFYVALPEAGPEAPQGD